MNTFQISNIVRQHSPEFLGVLPGNHLYNLKNNGFVIVNTDECYKTGRHWVALYLNDFTCEFFDSLGQSPTHYHNSWHKFLFEKSGEYIFNDRRIQKLNSDDCGKYCIIYVILRSRGLEFKTIIEMIQNIDLNSFLINLII